MASSRNNGVQADTLFLAVTRPPMWLGVTHDLVFSNLLIVTMLIPLTGNILWILFAIPIHFLFAMLLKKDCHFFGLFKLAAMTKGKNWARGNARYWQASSYAPMRYTIADENGQHSPKQTQLWQQLE